MRALDTSDGLLGPYAAHLPGSLVPTLAVAAPPRAALDRRPAATAEAVLQLGLADRLTDQPVDLPRASSVSQRRSQVDVTSAKLVVPTMYESLLAFVLGVLISLGYALAGQLPGGTLVAETLLRGIAVGLTSAGLIATVRFSPEKRVRR